MMYLVLFVIIVGGTGAVGFIHTMNAGMSIYDKVPPALTNTQVPKYDVNKPTVAVLLANETTEVFGIPVMLGILSLLIAYFIDRRFIRRKKQSSADISAPK